MAQFLMKPKIDFAFKEIMMDGNSLNGFQAAEIHLDPENIKETSNQILDFTLFKKEAGFYSCFHIREDTRGFLYTDKMEFHVIELPKLPPELKEDCTGLELWAKFINAERKEEFDMLAGRDPYIDSAYQQLQVISQDKQKRLEYEAREKAVRDYNQGMFEAKEKGREEGKQEESIRVAKDMLLESFDIKITSKISGLPLPEVEKLKITLLGEANKNNAP